MSLVLDNLKKLKKKSAGGSVPPSMVNLAPKKRRTGRPGPVLLILLVLSLIGSGIVFFLDSGDRTYKVTKPAREKAQPVRKAAEAPKTQPAEQKPPAPAFTAEALQSRIDAAVTEALKKAEQDFAGKLESAREANIQRAQNIDSLPEPFERKTIKKTQPEPEQEPVAKPEAEGDNFSRGIQSQLDNIKANRYGAEQTGQQPEKDTEEAERPMRRVMSDAQRAEFEKKIKYNTLASTGERYLREGRYDRASENFEQALEIKQTEAGLANLIKAKIGRGDYQSVSLLLRRYSGLVNAKIVSAAAFDLESAGFSEQALGLLSGYTGVFENDGVLYYAAGQINERDGNFQRAEAAYRRASELFPADAYYLFALARMLDVNGRLAEAAEFYKKVSTLDTAEEIKRSSAEREAMISEYLKMREIQEGQITSDGEVNASQ